VNESHSSPSLPAPLSPDNDPYGYKAQFLKVATAWDCIQPLWPLPIALMPPMPWLMIIELPPAPLAHTNTLENNFNYSMHLKAMADACEWVQQHRPLPLVLMMILPCLLACTMMDNNIVIHEPLSPLSPQTTPMNYSVHLAELIDKMEWMQWLIPAKKMPTTMPSIQVNNNPKSLPLACTNHNVTTKSLTASALEPMLPPQLLAPMPMTLEPMPITAASMIWHFNSMISYLY